MAVTCSTGKYLGHPFVFTNSTWTHELLADMVLATDAKAPL